jgi:hypothetical protein
MKMGTDMLILVVCVFSLDQFQIAEFVIVYHLLPSILWSSHSSQYSDHSKSFLIVARERLLN